MSRSDRRSGRRGCGRQRGQVDFSFTGMAATEPDLKGISLAEEVFNSGTSATSTKGQVPILEQLLGNIATPSRGNQPIAAQRPGIPCGPPAHAPSPLAPPSMPPPPSMPASVCQAPEQWEPPRTAAPQLPDAAFASYREKLRAGGRGAFQRTIDAGIMPRAMRQDWSAAQMPSEPAPGYLPQQQEMQSGAGMQYEYAVPGESQHMWSVDGQPQTNAWEVPLGQTDFSPQCTYMQQLPQQMVSPAHDFPQLMPMTDQLSMPLQAMGQQQQMQLQMPFQASTPMTAQPPQAMQLPPMGTDEQSMHMLQIQLPQMQASQMDLPQTPMSQMSGDSTPSEIERCMAIVMPQTTQFACDRDLMAAQLRAAADCQCYED